jgi:ClpP class serine protease
MKIDFYTETPGGSGEAAEEIAKFLRKKFEGVNFVIAGEAKSAGTILVLSGDNIYMTDTGSLGPIDAQVKIGDPWFRLTVTRLGLM